MSDNRPARLFGTDGIRGVAGRFPLDGDTLRRIARSLCRRLGEDLGRSPRLIVGRDTRESGPEIEEALVEGLTGEGAHVSLAGIMTTPGVAYLVRSIPFDAGIVISASHNPYHDNGIKVFSPTGRKLSDAMERLIETDVASPESAAPSPGGRSQGSSTSVPGLATHYLSYLVGDVARGLSLDGLRVGVDCANGAASFIAPQVVERLGATVKVIAAEPDGRNINEGCGSLHLDALRGVVVGEHLDLGFAFDGDADRVLFVDEEGSVVDGDHMLLILAESMKGDGRLTGDLVVSTVMGNVGLELALVERGIQMIRAQVGDRYVLEELLARGAKLGGEQSGHIIFPYISLAGDGIITALELLRAVRRSGMSLGRLASALTRFPQILVNVRVRSKPDFETVDRVRVAIEEVEKRLAGRGRLLVRYSGTENLARVMVEGDDRAEIEGLASGVAAAIEAELGE